jgi:hypothetical protein
MIANAPLAFPVVRVPGDANHVRPRVQDLHRVVALPGVGNAEHDRFLAEIQPRRRIQRVDVGADDVLHRRVRECLAVIELVGGLTQDRAVRSIRTSG